MARRHNGEGTIYRYRSGYAAQVWVTTPQGRRERKTVYGKTREVVHDKWVELQEQARRGPVTTKVPRLDEFAVGWLRDVVSPSLAPTTAANYELFTRLYIVPDLGMKRLDRLSVRDVRLWLNELKQRCQCCAQGKDAARESPRCCAAGQCCHQIASEWTVHQAWTVLRSMLSEAMREELVSRNVAGLVRVPVPRAGKPALWTVEEARRFLESARSDGDPMYAGYVLLLILGLRRGELLGLAWEDLDLERGEARIAWQVQRVKGELVRRQTKTPLSDAPLPLPDSASTRSKTGVVPRRGCDWPQVRHGPEPVSFSRRASVMPSIPGTSTEPSRPVPPRPAFPLFLFTPPAARAQACWWHWTSTPGSPWRSSVTARSR